MSSEKKNCDNSRRLGNFVLHHTSTDMERKKQDNICFANVILSCVTIIFLCSECEQYQFVKHEINRVTEKKDKNPCTKFFLKQEYKTTGAFLKLC